MLLHNHIFNIDTTYKTKNGEMFKVMTKSLITYDCLIINCFIVHFTVFYLINACVSLISCRDWSDFFCLHE